MYDPKTNQLKFSGTLKFVNGQLTEVRDGKGNPVTDPPTHHSQKGYVVAVATVILTHSQDKYPDGWCNVYYGSPGWKVPC